MSIVTHHLKYCPIPLVLILVFGLVLHFFNEEEFYPIVVMVSAVLMGSIIAVQALFIAKQSGQRRSIPLSYGVLAVAYFAYALAELTWFVLDSTGLPVYPSGADHAYALYFVMSIAHVYFIYKHFIIKPHPKEIMMVVAVVATILILYTCCFSGEDVNDFDFFYGGTFVSLAAVLLALTILTTYKLRNTMLFGAWVLIGTGIAIGAMGDVWYYPLEGLEMYQYGHYLDLVWFASDAIIIFALNVHRKLV